MNSVVGIDKYLCSGSEGSGALGNSMDGVCELAIAYVTEELISTPAIAIATIVFFEDMFVNTNRFQSAHIYTEFTIPFEESNV